MYLVGYMATMSDLRVGLMIDNRIGVYWKIWSFGASGGWRAGECAGCVLGDPRIWIGRVADLERGTGRDARLASLFSWKAGQG